MKTYKKILLTFLMLFFSTNLFAAQSQIAQVNGMMCIKCQKMVTKALQAASPNATVKVSWPEGVAVSSFTDKSNLTDDLSSHTIDSTFSVDTFEKGQKVDVTGVTIGKGFSGAQKRHHFRSQRATHGVSVSHNSLGSTGHCQDPGRVFPGKKMSGQLGSKRRTTQNLEVVRIDSKRNLILIKGAIPGSKGSDIEIKPAIKVKVGK